MSLGYGVKPVGGTGWGVGLNPSMGLGSSHAFLGVSFEPEIAQPAISGRLSPLRGGVARSAGVVLLSVDHNDRVVIYPIRI